RLDVIDQLIVNGGYAGAVALELRQALLNPLSHNIPAARLLRLFLIATVFLPLGASLRRFFSRCRLPLSGSKWRIDFVDDFREFGIAAERDLVAIGAPLVEPVLRVPQIRRLVHLTQTALRQCVLLPRGLRIPLDRFIPRLRHANAALAEVAHVVLA